MKSDIKQMRLNTIDLYPVNAGLLLFGLLFYSVNVSAGFSHSHLQANAGDVIQVKLSELHPTQRVLGKLQVAGELADYAADSKSLFKKLCKVQGAGKLEQANASSTPKDPSSYRCKYSAGTQKIEMNTVDIGPEGILYLTDGHHAFSSFWDAPNGGRDVTLSVLVAQNMSHDSQGEPLTQRQFEQQMAERKHFLPSDAEGQTIVFSQLPDTLEMSKFQDDPYRSILYYLRGIAYDKSDKNLNPKTGKPYPDIPFLEFYWGDVLRSKMDLTRYNLHKQDDYINALKEAAVLIVSLPDKQLAGTSGYTAAALGQMDRINQTRLDKLAKPDSKLAKALQYQSRHK